jgi:hypothetical protein
MMTIMRMRSAILTIAYYISAIFADTGISEGFGKLVRIDLHPITPNNLLAVPPETGTTNRRLAWILTGNRTNSVILTLPIGVICKKLVVADISHQSTACL